MRATLALVALAASGFVLAGCGEQEPIAKVPPLIDMSIPLAGCLPSWEDVYHDNPPCLSGIHCTYPIGDDAGLRPVECDCVDEHWVCAL